jgi:hypothetical protein|tara:strand:- start:707 stop:1213 length:507 start_codon:yes stop_codon:yes gene_type:complete
MTYSNALSPVQMTAQLRQLPGHRYWDNTVLQADRFLWSWSNRIEPTTFGGDQVGLVPGDTSINVTSFFNSSESNNAAYSAHFGQTPSSDISVAMPTAAQFVANFGFVAGEYFEFSYTNLSADIITVTASAGGLTEVGVMTIAANTTARFRVYISVATSSVEAGSLIRL